MNHSEESTSEENLSFKNASRHPAIFSTKKKQVSHLERNSLQLSPTHEIENDYPKSIQKIRYNQVNVQPNDIALEQPHSYQKQIIKKDYQKGKNLMMNFYEKSSQRSSEAISSNKNKKCSDTIFTPFDVSFDDRISIQTMDSKQFTDSFEFENNQLVDLVLEVNQSQKKSSNHRETKDKNYFDNHIIQHENQDDQEREQSPNKQKFHSGNSRFIEIQNPSHQLRRDYSQIYASPQQQNLIITQKSQYEFKSVLQQKQKQAAQLREAYFQTTQQNDILRNRIKELELCLKKIVEQKRSQNIRESNPQFSQKKSQFQQSVKIFRKFSF